MNISSRRRLQLIAGACSLVGLTVILALVADGGGRSGAPSRPETSPSARAPGVDPDAAASIESTELARLDGGDSAAAGGRVAAEPAPFPVPGDVAPLPDDARSSERRPSSVADEREAERLELEREIAAARPRDMSVFQEQGDLRFLDDFLPGFRNGEAAESFEDWHPGRDDNTVAVTGGIGDALPSVTPRRPYFVPQSDPDD